MLTFVPGRNANFCEILSENDKETKTTYANLKTQISKFNTAQQI